MYFIIYHFIRPLWNLPLMFIFWVVYFFKAHFTKSGRASFGTNITSYMAIKDLAVLAAWFRTSYAYKWDGPLGILDHDNTAVEFFTDFGDCDDVATWAGKKLKALGYKTTKLLIIGKPFYWLHFDVMFEKEGKTYLFNYGHIIEVDGLLRTIKLIDSHFFKYVICKW